MLERFLLVLLLVGAVSGFAPAAGAAKLATSPYRIDEVPSPLGGDFSVGPVSETGLVAGCAERSPDDWVVFVWDPVGGKRILDAGWTGARSTCRPGTINPRGMLAGFLPGGGSRAVPFVWSETLGLQVFPMFPIVPPFATYRLLLNRSGQLAGGKQAAFVWTERDGLIALPQGMGFSDAVIDQNEAGTLMGIVSTFDESAPFVWERTAGVTPFLAGSESPRTTARYLSEDGWVTGRTLTAPFTYPGYVRSPEGEIHTFSLGGDAISVNAIGSGGLAVGTAESDDGFQYAYAFEPGHGIEILSLGGLPTSFDIALDVNNSGLVVGQASNVDRKPRAFAWQRDQGITEIGLGGETSFALTVTDSGYVVGRAQNRSGQGHPFVWTRDMGVVELSWGGNGLFSIVRGVSESGTVIGESPDANGMMRPFVWTRRSGLRDPGRWLPPLEPGTVFTTNLRPNGVFLVRGTDPGDGRTRTFVLTPLPPSSFSSRRR